MPQSRVTVAAECGTLAHWALAANGSQSVGYITDALHV